MCWRLAMPLFPSSDLENLKLTVVSRGTNCVILVTVSDHKAASTFGGEECVSPDSHFVRFRCISFLGGNAFKLPRLVKCQQEDSGRKKISEQSKRLSKSSCPDIYVLQILWGSFSIHSSKDFLGFTLVLHRP